MVLLSHLAATTPRKKRNKHYVPVYLTLRRKQPKIMIFQIPRIPPSPFQTKNAPFLTIPQHENSWRSTQISFTTAIQLFINRLKRPCDKQ